MKRGVLVLAGLIALWIALRQSPAVEEGSRQSEVVGVDTIDGQRPAEPREGSQNSASATQHHERGGTVRAEATPNAPQASLALQAETMPGSHNSEVQERTLDHEMLVEDQPLVRYADDDALALRRGRQIQLVTRAQEQARDALAEAEESGDRESAARTRGVLRRLQLRLDALEAAATAEQPY